jgi:DNA-binding transcriptional ArsR family regulator
VKADFESLAPLADEATTLLKALAHPARLAICCQLREQEMSVGDMEERLGIKQPRLSRELGKLREEGLVTTRRKSKVVFYQLSDAPRLKAMVDAICAVMRQNPHTIFTRPEQTAARQVPRPGGYGVFARPVF